MPTPSTTKIAKVSLTGKVDMDSAGTLYEIEPDSARLRCIETDGRIRWENRTDLISPIDITLHPSGSVLVVDRGHCSLLIFDALTGRILHRVGQVGSGVGQLNLPHAVAARSGRIYLADSANHRIVVLDEDGNWLKSLGRLGSATGQLSFPRGLAIDPAGNLHVVDSGNARVCFILSEDDFTVTCYEPVTDFKFPRDIDIHSSGLIAVADATAGLIAIFDQNFRLVGTHRPSLGQSALQPLGLEYLADGQLHLFAGKVGV